MVRVRARARARVRVRARVRARVRVRVRVRARARARVRRQDADAPPIGAEGVAFVQDDLRREVLGRAAQRPRAVRHDLGEAEVDHLEVALAVEQQVLRFQVAVDHLARGDGVGARGDGCEWIRGRSAARVGRSSWLWRSDSAAY